MRRRRFLQDSLKITAGVFLARTIVPSIIEKKSSCSLASHLVRIGSIGIPEVVRIGIQDAALIEKSGQHYFDCATWGTGTEHTSPVSSEGVASGSNVSCQFIARVDYMNGITILTGTSYPDGIMFEGPGGWIFATEDGDIEASDPHILKPVIMKELSHQLPAGEHKIATIIQSALKLDKNKIR